MHSKDIYKIAVVLQPKSFFLTIFIMYSMMLLHVGFSAMALLVFAYWRQVSIERCMKMEWSYFEWMRHWHMCLSNPFKIWKKKFSQEKCQEHWKMPAMSRNSLLFADNTFVEISHTSISRLNPNEFVASSGFLPFPFILSIFLPSFPYRQWVAELWINTSSKMELLFSQFMPYHFG